MRSERPVRFYLPPQAQADLQRLHDLADGTPRGSRARNLAAVALNTVVAIKKHGQSTHALEFMPSYPDLSDCQTTYVGADPNAKPSHRVVWRDVPSEQAGEPPLREIIALGERQAGAVYHLAGSRLGRPTGVRLEDLEAAPEPIASHSPTRQRSTGFENSPPVDDGPQLG